jgi:hypothetical protein
MIVEAGEEMFERFANAVGLRAERLEEAGRDKKQRPDFRVIGTDGQLFIAEVKLVTPSQEEAASIAQFDETGTCGFSTTPGKKLRGLISKSNSQLRAMSHLGLPGALVVFNPNWHLKFHTESYAVLTAMRGLDTIPVSVPTDPALSPVFGDMRPGPRKQMTAGSNTSTSAIICPREDEDDGWMADVFHNSFAVRPLSVAAVAHPRVRHWRLADDDSRWESAQISAF